MIPIRYINSGPMAAQASAAPAMAAGKAVESVGNAIADVGMMGMEMAGKVRRIEEQGKINAFMAQADEEAGRFAIDLAQRSDTDAWPKEWTDRTAKLREQAGKLGLSPEGMAHLDQEFTGWSSTRSIHFETQAATKKLGIARAQTTQALQYYAGRGDKEGFDRTLATATFLDPAERERAQMHFNQTAAGNELQRMVDENPQSVIDAEPETLLKRMPGATLEMIQSAKGAAESAKRRNLIETAATAQDDIVSGKVLTSEEIDTRYPTLSPSAREDLKTYMRRRNDAAFKAEQATPENQQRVFGEVGAMMRDWNPEVDGVDGQMVKMQTMLDPLPDSPMKDAMMQRIQEIRTGRRQEVRSHAEAAQRALDDADKAGFFGSAAEPEKPVTSKMVNDGFLRDTGKLKALGFSDEQIATIQAETVTAGGEKRPATDRSRAQAFRMLYEQRKGEVSADPLTQAIGEAIAKDQPSVNYVNPEDEDKAIERRMDSRKAYGAAKQKLAEWLKVNPDAKPEQIDSFIRDLTDEPTARRLSSGIYERQASPPGASASTSTVPVGKDLTEIVKNFEAADGFHAKAYWDYGQWSIGYGTRAKEGEVIDQAEADRRLSNELGSARNDVETAAEKAGLSLTAHELDALTSFQFNTGKIGTLLAGGKRTKAEIAEAMLLYRNADGQRLRGLENRRAAERALFLNGYNS